METRETSCRECLLIGQCGSHAAANYVPGPAARVCEALRAESVKPGGRECMRLWATGGLRASLRLRRLDPAGSRGAARVWVAMLRWLATACALLAALPAHASPVGKPPQALQAIRAPQLPVRDYAACSAAWASGWQPPLGVARYSVVYPVNPYVRASLTPDEIEAISDLRQEIADGRDAVDQYLDVTAPREVAVNTVRSMVVGVMMSVTRLRCLDRDGGAELEQHVRVWADAVERELRSDELEQKCAQYCETAKPRCAPDECVVDRD